MLSLCPNTVDALSEEVPISISAIKIVANLFIIDKLRSIRQEQRDDDQLENGISVVSDPESADHDKMD